MNEVSPASVVTLIKRPGMYRCAQCGKVSGANSVVQMDGCAVHSGCVIKALKHAQGATAS